MVSAAQSMASHPSPASRSDPEISCSEMTMASLWCRSNGRRKFWPQPRLTSLRRKAGFGIFGPGAEYRRCFRCRWQNRATGISPPDPDDRPLRRRRHFGHLIVSQNTLQGRSVYGGRSFRNLRLEHLGVLFEQDRQCVEQLRCVVPRQRFGLICVPGGDGVEDCLMLSDVDLVEFGIAWVSRLGSAQLQVTNPVDLHPVVVDD